MIDPFAFLSVAIFMNLKGTTLILTCSSWAWDCVFHSAFPFDSKKVLDCYVFPDQIAIYYPSARYQEMPVD